MDRVLTLIASRLDEDHVRTAAAELPHPHEIEWLADERACDLFFSGPVGDIAAALSDLPIDWLVQAAAGRRKKLLLADMDSTIITIECIDELADLMGLKAEISEITERAMRGEIDFPSALRARAGKLTGIHRKDIHRLIEERVRLTPGARTLVMTMRANDAHTALISGGFTTFTAAVRVMAGFHEDRANELLFENDCLSGKVGEPILGADAKRAALVELSRNLGISALDALAIGDGANDIPMLKGAGLGLAYRAKPATRQAADGALDYCDLTGALYFQGYRESEFVA